MIGTGSCFRRITLDVVLRTDGSGQERKGRNRRQEVAAAEITRRTEAAVGISGAAAELLKSGQIVKYLLNVELTSSADKLEVWEGGWERDYV